MLHPLLVLVASPLVLVTSPLSVSYLPYTLSDMMRSYKCYLPSQCQLPPCQCQLPPILVLVTSHLSASYPLLLVLVTSSLVLVTSHLSASYLPYQCQLPTILVLVTSPLVLVTSPLSASYLPSPLSEMMRSYGCFQHVSKMLTLSHNRENSIVIKNAIILTVDFCFLLMSYDSLVCYLFIKMMAKVTCSLLQD